MGRRMTAILVHQFRELVPKHSRKLLARALGVSPESAKRYLSDPSTFPKSRADRLLSEIERRETQAELRREERRQARAEGNREIQAWLAMDRPGVAAEPPQHGAGLAGGASVAHVGGVSPASAAEAGEP